MGTCKDNYIEREWRKVYSCPSPLKWLSENEYYIYRGDRSVSKQPKGKILHFSTKDIVFIIIPNKFKDELSIHIGENYICIVSQNVINAHATEFNNLIECILKNIR